MMTASGHKANSSVDLVICLRVEEGEEAICYHDIKSELNTGIDHKCRLHPYASACNHCICSENLKPCGLSTKIHGLPVHQTVQKSVADQDIATGTVL